MVIDTHLYQPNAGSTLPATPSMIHMPDQRVRVFVSSTIDELAAERSAAQQAITQLHLTPVLFELGARPYPPQDLYRSYLAQSDIFVGIYWQHYGWVAPSMEVSGPKDEYQFSAGKPRLIYVKTPAPEREPRLQGLLNRIREEGTASYEKFSSSEELRELLANDLAQVLTDRFTSVSEMTHLDHSLSSHNDGKPVQSPTNTAAASNLRHPATVLSRLPSVSKTRGMEKADSHGGRWRGSLAPAVLLVLLAVLMVSGLIAGPSLLRSRTQAFSTQTPNMHSAVGQLSFISSGQVRENSTQGIADTIQLQLQLQHAPAAGKQYYAWLLPDQGNAEAATILLGTIARHGSVGQVSYSDPQHTNLLVSMSRLLVTEQDATITPLSPSTDHRDWRYTASIAQMRTVGTAYSLLDHIRHLLAKDPMLEGHGLHGGLVIWLQHDTDQLFEESTEAQGAWRSGTDADLGQMRQQLMRLLISLDGVSYAPLELPPNTPYAGLLDPPASNIGLLTFNSQQPFSIVEDIDFHLQGVAASPGVSTRQQQEAAKILAVMDQINAWLNKVRDDDRHLLMMSDRQLQQPAALTLLNDMQMNAMYASSGKMDQTTVTRKEGTQWVYQEIQHLATMDVTPK